MLKYAVPKVWQIPLGAMHIHTFNTSTFGSLAGWPHVNKLYSDAFIGAPAVDFAFVCGGRPRSAAATHPHANLFRREGEK